MEKLFAMMELLQKLFQDLRPRFTEALQKGTDITTAEKGQGELVTSFDLSVNQLICEFLTSHFPGVEIISEEGTVAWPPKTEECFIVDPVDGTHNLSQGIPLFGTLITYIRDGLVTAVFIYLPLDSVLMPWRSGLYFAGRGLGAWEWQVPALSRLQVSEESNLQGAFMLLEGVAAKLFDSRAVQRLVAGTRRSRLGLGSCYSMTRLARASLHPKGPDLMVFLEQKPWDNLPACLLIEEAGGTVMTLDGEPWSIKNCQSLIFTNQLLDNQVLKTLKE